MTKPRRFWRWTKRILLGLLAVVTVAVGVALIVLHTDRGRDWIRSRVEAELRAQFPGGASVGKVEGSVLGELVVRDVKLAAIDGAPFATIDTLEVEVALLPLIGKTIRVERVTADGVDVILPRQIRRPAAPTAKPKQPASWDVAIDKLQLRRARIAIESEREPITLEDVTLDGTVSLPAGGPITASATATGTWKERGAPVKITTDVRKDDRVRVRSLIADVGNAHIGGTDLIVDIERLERSTGKIEVSASPATIAALVPGLDLPHELGDMKVEVTGATASGGLRLALAGDVGTTGKTTVRGSIDVDPDARTARGVVTVTSSELATWSRNAVTGEGTVTATVVAERSAAGDSRLRGWAVANGALADIPAKQATAAFDMTETGGSAVITASGDGGLHAAVIAGVKRTGDVITVEHARVMGTLNDAASASGDRVPLVGELQFEATARGPLRPQLALEVHDGTFAGDKLRVPTRTAVAAAQPSGTGMTGVVATGRARAIATARAATEDRSKEIAVARVRGTFTGRIDATAITGSSHVDVTGIARGGKPLGDAKVDGRARADGTIAANIVARAAAADVTAVLEAVISLPPAPGQPFDIALGNHTVRAPRGITWRGRGGRIVASKESVSVTGLRSTSGAQRVDASGSYTIASEAFDVTADVRAIEAAMFHGTYRGTASGHVQLHGQGTRWTGKARLTVDGLAVRADVPPIDGEVAVAITGSHVKVDATAVNDRLGKVRLALDVDGPADLTDGMAWRRLERRAVRSATVALTRVDLAGTPVPTGGVVDGEIVLAGADTRGALTVRGARTKLGKIDGDIAFAPLDRSELGAASTVHVEGVGDANIAARIAFPLHPFDPVAWQQLGRGVVRLATVTVEDVAIDPAKLAALGVRDQPYRGRLDATIAISAGDGAANATVELRGVSGGTLVKPVDAHVEATVDRNGSVVVGKLRAGRAGAEPGPWAAGEQLLARVDATLGSMTFDRWLLATAKTAIHAPVRGTVTIPKQGVKDVLALIGRTDVTAGQLEGSFAIAGTVGVPTARGAAIARDVQVPSRIPGKKVPTLVELRVAGEWGGVAGRIDITGKESDGETLEIHASGRPDQLASIIATADVVGFDLTPVAMFLPGSFVAASGKLDASLSVSGLHPGGKIRGKAKISKGRVPLPSSAGTLREANVDVVFDQVGMRATADGKLGAGKVSLVATSTGHDLTDFDVTAVVDDIAPIGELEPKIDAKITAKVRRVGKQVLADVRIRDGSIIVPEQKGRALLEAEAPSDLYLSARAAAATKEPPKLTRPPPERPWLIATVDLGSTKIEAGAPIGINGRFSARRLVVSVGGGGSIGIEGTVDVERGSADIYGRRYIVDPGPEKIRFDGSTDGLLALGLVYEFPDVTLIVSVTNRFSKPLVELSSQPAVYSQGQLLGFFVGGTPGGDPSRQAREAATGAGAGVVSDYLGRKVKKRLPFKVDTIRCEPGSSASGASCTVGRYIGDKLFLAYKRNFEARPDEYPDDIQLQYQLNRSWILEGSGWGNHVGADVLWRKRW